MRITVVRPHELGVDDLALWRRFQRETPGLANPFLAPEFTVVAGRVRPQTRVAVLSDATGTVGFFPFERGPLGVGLPVAPGLNDCQGLVHAPGVVWDAGQLLRACKLTVWEFDHLVDGQMAFESYGRARFASSYMDLSGGFAAYNARVERRAVGQTGQRPLSRRDLRRKETKLTREVGPMRVATDCPDPALLRTLMSWKSEQYRRSGTYDRFARWWIVSLVNELHATRTPAFSGSLLTLHAGDVPVAGIFGLRAGDVTTSWFPAFAWAYRRFSPGMLLFWQGAEAQARDGVRIVDLGRGDEMYKQMFKTGDLPVWEGQITRPSAAAAARWARRTSVRRLRKTVTSSHALYRFAEPVRNLCGRLDSAVRHRVTGSSLWR